MTNLCFFPIFPVTAGGGLAMTNAYIAVIARRSVVFYDNEAISVFYFCNSLDEAYELGRTTHNLKN
jgi:hypothetical protein